MDISRLIDRSNKMFELLEYTGVFTDYDEIVSLKISINNLLVGLEAGKPNFFEVLMLSSPVLFDFAFNSKLDEKGLQIRKTFEKQKYYNEGKKWYKFIRNSLIHTNRYTYNNFLKSIYRIEYLEGAAIYFELDPKKRYRFQEFQENRYYQQNELINDNFGMQDTFIVDENVRIEINYDYFNKFVLEMISGFVRSAEHDIDSILKDELNKWNNYYVMYQNVVYKVLSERHVDVKSLRKLTKALERIGVVELEERYVLCEFLVYLSNLNVELDDKVVTDIIDITTFDKYLQIDNRQLVLNEIANVKDYEKIYISFDLVVWILNEIHPLTGMETEFDVFEHTNYLIMYVQKYLNKRGVIINE